MTEGDRSVAITFAEHCEVVCRLKEFIPHSTRTDIFAEIIWAAMVEAERRRKEEAK